MHLVCFIVRIYHDARSTECQMGFFFFVEQSEGWERVFLSVFTVFAVSCHVIKAPR